ncbi:MAG: hypothetical protein HY917_05585 [Candidatus Diapherotrites archaeon]|nr:hypothetical protein [Candidatus Diapherotrites archaeon]
MTQFISTKKGKQLNPHLAEKRKSKFRVKRVPRTPADVIHRKILQSLGRFLVENNGKILKQTPHGFHLDLPGKPNPRVFVPFSSLAELRELTILSKPMNYQWAKLPHSVPGSNYFAAKINGRDYFLKQYAGTKKAKEDGIKEAETILEKGEGKIHVIAHQNPKLKGTRVEYSFPRVVAATPDRILFEYHNTQSIREFVARNPKHKEWLREAFEEFWTVPFLDKKLLVSSDFDQLCEQEDIMGATVPRIHLPLDSPHHVRFMLFDIKEWKA